MVRRAGTWLQRLLSRRQRRLERLRAHWGKAGNGDGWLAGRYFELTRTHDVRREVDDRTWNDLEFPRIFALMDTTLTRPGSQCLYRQLRSYVDANRLGRQYGTFEALRKDRDLRERIQLALARLGDDAAALMADDLFGPPATEIRYRPLLLAWSLASLLALGVLLVLHGVATTALFLGVLAVNLAVVMRSTSAVSRRTLTIRNCADLVRVANDLAEIRTARSIPQLDALVAAAELRRRVRRPFKPFQRLGNLPLGADEWLNILCLAKWLVGLWALERLDSVREDLRILYSLVGSLDATIAVAGFLERTGACCRAEPGPPGHLELRDACHPLLRRPVPNSLDLDGRSLLVSGSNMAGKTTFVKTLACNVLLGRTLGICLAGKAVLPEVPVLASIRNEHSVESGKSRYFAETEALLEFLRCAERECTPLLVIDEPFSGTNTRERIAAANAVLAALGRNAQVLATTHDVELQALLAGSYTICHFTEDPDVDGFFDYRLRPGPCSEGNAIRLLERIGFPTSVIADARAQLASR